MRGKLGAGSEAILVGIVEEGTFEQDLQIQQEFLCQSSWARLPQGLV